MKITKCRTCKYYDNFFGSCKLYYTDVYLGEGSYDILPVPIREISKSECEYESCKGDL